MCEKMWAGVVHAKDDIRYEQIDKPEPRAGEVLVKVKYSGICGSDVPRVLGDACHYYPNVLGHEFSGTIESVGEGVEALLGGHLVIAVRTLRALILEIALPVHHSFLA